MTRTADVALSGLADALAGGEQRGRAIARLALDFWTWRRLNSEGLDDDAAAGLMAELMPSAG